MDRDLVEGKLESLRHWVDRITDKTPRSVDHLLRDPDAVPPSTMAENFAVLRKLHIIDPALSERLTKAVGFRNVAVHSYQSINRNIAYQICTEHLDEFRQFAKAVVRHLHRA